MGKNNSKELAQTKAPKGRLDRKKKIALSVIVLAVLATVAFAVMVFVFDLGPARPIKSTDEEAKVVGECAGYDVKYEELRYVTMINKRALDAKYGDYDSLDESARESYAEELEVAVMKDIKNNYVILSLCDKYGIDTDSKEVRNHVSDSLESVIDELGGMNKYTDWLKENYLTDSFLRLVYKVDYLESKLLEKFIADKIGIEYDETTLYDFVSYAFSSSDYVKTIHAYYPKDWSYSDGRGARAHATAAYNALVAVEDSEERYSLMCSTIGKAPYVPGYSTTGTNFYFTYEQIEYEDIAFSLSLYDVELFENEEAYYVIMRVPKVRDEISSRALEFLEEYRYSVLKRYENEQSEKISFAGNSSYDGIELINIK